AKFVRLEFELFPKPSGSDFLRIHQFYRNNVFIITYNDLIVYKVPLSLREVTSVKEPGIDSL
ncbi:MAG: hypothetical protein KJO34_04065, partial [Deltaproteobacteria bacterium]|nr:hypothetical protein [Deltaproteobacteria bacterium]